MSGKLNIDKMSEGIDYELIPVDYVDHKDAWDVRILRGEFTETVIRFGTIKFDGKQDNLRFDFRVITSPISGVSSEVVELQDCAGDILFDILERGFTEGWLYGTKEEVDNGEDIGNTIRTDNSEELTH
jgi:hypothetical protein